MSRGAGALLRAYYQALDTPNLDDLDRILAPELQWTFPGSRLCTAALVKRAMARSLATGLTMQHDIGHLLEKGNVAICELVATNRLNGKDYLVPGAVVCEEAHGQIVRLAAYPDPDASRPFFAALAEARTGGR